jgi:hypothetical protein
VATIDDLIKSIDSLTKGLETDRKERKKSEGTTTPSQTPSQSSAYTQEEFNRFKRQKEDEIALTDDLNKKRSLQNEILEKQKVLLQATEKDEAKRRKGLKDLNKEIEKNNELTEESNKLQEQGAGFANSLGTAFGLVRKESSFMYNAIKAVSSEDGLKGLSKNLKEATSGANLAASGFAKISETMLKVGFDLQGEFQGAITSFNQQTGMLTEEARKQIEFSAANVMRYGVSVNTSLFANDEIRGLGNTLIEETALMTKFGVSAETTAASMDILVRSLGMSGGEALETQKRIAALGIELGVGAGRMAASFAENLPRLSLYGTQAESIFNRTAVAATKMGLGVEDVLNLGESFQTFEGAATSAGRLNAILGGGFVDNIALMQASFEDPAKAAMMVRDAIAQANQNAQSLGAMGIKAVGDILGISDMSKVRKFLEGGPSEDIFKELQDPMISLQETAANSQTLAQQQYDYLKDQQLGLLHGMNGSLSGIDTNLRSLLSDFGGFPVVFGTILATTLAPLLMGQTLGGLAKIAPLTGVLASGGAAALGGTALTAGIGLLGPIGLALGGVAAAAMAYKSLSSDSPQQPARTQARQVTAATQRATQTTQRAMSSTQRMAAQTDTLIKETNSTLSDVRSLLNDIKSNTASTGKQVSSALKAG